MLGAMAFSIVMPRRESSALLWIRRTLITVACIHMLFFGWSMFRRIWQVLRIDLRPSSTVLTPGTTVSYDVITTGETHNRILLQLVQGEHAETLLEQRARVNSVSAYDPRMFQYTPTIRITGEMLARFSSGPATLRLTGFGGQKLLRTPAPKVREVEVEIPR